MNINDFIELADEVKQARDVIRDLWKSCPSYALLCEIGKKETNPPTTTQILKEIEYVFYALQGNLLSIDEIRKNFLPARTVESPLEDIILYIQEWFFRMGCRIRILECENPFENVDYQQYLETLEEG